MQMILANLRSLSVVAVLSLGSGPAWAASLEVHLLPVIEASGSHVDPELTLKLRESLEAHAPKSWNVVHEPDTGSTVCNASQACVIVSVTRYGNTYKLRASLPDGELLAGKSVTLPGDTDAIDVADALVVKLVFLLKKVKLAKADTGPGAGDEKGVSGEGHHQEEPIEPPSVEGVAVEGAAEEAPAEPIEDASLPAEPVVITLPETGPPTEPPPVQPAPAPARKVEGRLPVSGSFLTGFNKTFNSGGLDVGLILVFYRAIGLRLDAGVLIGGASDDEGSIRQVVLPMDLMGGYRGHFGRLRFGVSAGLYLMALFLDFLTQERGKTREFVIGIAAMVDMDFQITSSISLGFYLRPGYVTDDVNIQDGTTVVFRLPKFHLACGISLVINM